MENKEIEGRTFGRAIKSLKEGYKVARDGWNGKGMFLALVEGDNWGIGVNDPRDFKGAPMIKNSDFIGMKTADNKFVPWLASQTDILAEDWTVISN